MRELGLILLIVATIPLGDAYGNRLTPGYDMAGAIILAAVYVFAGISLITINKMKGNKK